MIIDTDLIIYYIRMLISNICVYYCYTKILNINKKCLRDTSILLVLNIIMLFIYVPVKEASNSFFPFIGLWFAYSLILARLTNNSWGYSTIITIISYAITFISHTIGIVIQYFPYNLLKDILVNEIMYLSLVIISIIQIVLIYCFFKIKRFKNGFSFINNKFNNEITDIIMINMSSIIIMVYCLVETYPEERRKYLFAIFIMLGVTMFFTIKKMITMYYKQKLLTDTMEEYKLEIVEMQNEIDKLKQDKQNVSKITHEFYNRQKALELLVTSNVDSKNIDKENIGENVLKIIESLTNEYSERFENIKDLPSLEKTDIPEIDNMFKYMQSECSKNSIEFKLKIMGNIHSLVNNIIPKNKLETLIGDHLRDAINAVNLSNIENKEILAILGMKDKKYELSIFDTGVEFEIDTLLKLGLERVTTNKERGGTGTGFMTTFETLNETKASLVITEYPLSNERHYTKCVTIRFDGKKQYRICSYRAKEIKKYCKDNRIKIESIGR